MAEGPLRSTGEPERKIPRAACDSSIPATECLAWHIHGRIPDAKISGTGMSVRCRCPSHDDGKPSLVVSVGDYAAITWHCHACGDDARLQVRAALISVYGVHPKCLPMSRQERAEMEAMIDAIFSSSYTPCTKLLYIRAVYEGLRGHLPPAPALVELGERAGVSERQAYRARRDLGGASLNHLFVPKIGSQVHDSKVKPAIRGSSSLPDRQSAPDWQQAHCQIGSGTQPAA